MFKIGDKVRRKAFYLDMGNWYRGDKICTIRKITPHTVFFEEDNSFFFLGYFSF